MSYNSTVIWEGGQVEYDDTYGTSYNWREVDTIQIPPFRLDGATPLPLVLELWAVSTSGSSETPELDCMKLVPVDGFKKLICSTGLEHSSVLVSDDILEDYYQTVSSAKVADVSTEGGPLMLYPGKANRIYYTWTNDDSTQEDWTMSTISVKAYYRPRRATL